MVDNGSARQTALNVVFTGQADLLAVGTPPISNPNQVQPRRS